MDEISEKALETSVSLVVQPFAGVVQDAIGLAGGDWLSEMRTRNRKKLEEKTKRICEERGVEQLDEPNPTTIAPIITAAQDESREELQDIWAKLLAAALDPGRNRRFRREFTESVKRFEPSDALVLIELDRENVHGTHANHVKAISLRTGLSHNQIAVSFRNLINCGCFMRSPGVEGQQFPIHGVFVSPLGHELLEVVLCH